MLIQGVLEICSGDTARSVLSYMPLAGGSVREIPKKRPLALLVETKKGMRVMLNVSSNLEYCLRDCLQKGK